MNEKLKVSDGLKVWIQDFLDSSAPQFKGKSPKERIKMAIAAFTDAGGKLKEGNMKNERMDQSKLTGQEISVYFRKNPVRDKTVKKAVEFALDHGGAMNFAIKGIEKIKRGLSKHPEVKKALKYANESVHHESVWKMKEIISENYTRNFKTLCQSLKLNGIQQKILDDFIHKGRIRDQYVGRVAGSKKETRIFAGKKKFSGSIDNRTEALMNALKVNAKQKSILDAYLKTGNVIGKYTGSIAGSTKDTKSYTGFRGFKEHFDTETVFETNLIDEGMSKPMTMKDVKAIEKKYGEKMSPEEVKDYLSTQVSPKGSARPEAWLSLSYPVRKGDYYFALIGKDRNTNIKMNIKMNDQLKKMTKVYDDPDPLYDNFMDWAYKNIKNAGVGDTMTREEIWASCLHILKMRVATVYVKEETLDEGFFKQLLSKLKRGIRNLKPKFNKKESVGERSRYGKSMSRKDIMRKHGNEFKKALRKGSLDLSDKAEGDLIQYIMDNHPEEIRTDDPDEWIEWLDDNLEDFVKGKGY